MRPPAHAARTPVIGLSPRLRARSWRLRRSYGFVLQPPVRVGLRTPRLRSRSRDSAVTIGSCCSLPRARHSRERASFSISAPAPTSEWVCAAASRAHSSPVATLAARSLHAGRPAASIAVLSTMAALSRPGQWPQWPCRWPISFCPAQAAYQPGQDIFIIRGCRFHIAPYKEFISGQAKLFFIKGSFYQGRPASMAILSTMWPQPSYQREAAKWPDLRIRALRGRFHIVPYTEFISGQAEPFYQGLAKRIAILSTPAAAFYQSRWPFYQANCRSIKRPKPNGHFIKTDQA